MGKQQTQEDVAPMRLLHPDAVGRETREVVHTFSDDEMNDLRTEYTDISVEKQEAEDEFSIIRKSHMDSMKEMKATLRNKLRNITTGSVTKAVDCELVPDFANDLMLYMDGEEIVHRRKLRPSERQMNILERNDDIEIGQTGN